MHSPVIPMLKMYGLFWLALFLFAVTAMLVSNGVFGVAWFAVADVALSLAIFVAAGVIAGCLVFIAMALVFGRIGRAIVMLLVGTIYALLPFAAVLAFALYAYIGAVPLTGESFVLEQFTDAVDAIINATGDAIAHTTWQMPARELITDVMLAISGGLAVLALAANWLTMRKVRTDN
jgi:hypothetical protein